MWKDRLKRIVIILVVAVLVFFAGKVFADWQKKKQVAGESILLPTKQIGEKIEDIGEEILGTAVRVLPGGESLKEKLESQEEKSEQKTEQGEVKGETKTETETQKVEKIEIKTQEIIQVIKELPAEQVNIIKKQVFKEFCQQVLEE